MTDDRDSLTHNKYNFIDSLYDVYAKTKNKVDLVVKTKLSFFYASYLSIIRSQHNIGVKPKNMLFYEPCLYIESIYRYFHSFY